MPQPLKEFLQRWAITTVGVLIAAHVVRGIHYESWQGLLVATLVLGLLNAFIRPILLLLSLPLLIVTLGLFTLVINALLLMLVGQIKGFHVDGFWAAFWGGVVISVASLLLNFVAGTGGTRVTVRKGRAGRPPDKPDGGGPIIDV
jgi:putative membrane protein